MTPTPSDPCPAGPAVGQVWRSPTLPGVELMLGINAGRRCRLLHESYTVCVVPHTGNAPTVLTAWKYRGHIYQFRPGDVSIEEPGEVHTCVRVYSPLRYCLLRIDPELMTAVAVELNQWPLHFPTPLIGTPRLYDVFARFYHALAQPSTQLEREVRLSTLLRHLVMASGDPLPEPATPPGVRAALARARDYLETHVAETVCLEQLSGIAGLSRFHFSRLFAGLYGLSPHAYQNQLRLRAIRERLRTESRVDALDAGFFDQSHLIRHFRDSMGMTPRAFATAQPTLPPLD